MINERYGLLGRHLAHSHSPILHKMIGGYDYGLFEIEPDYLAEFMDKREFAGINVTIPYKEEVIQYLDGISDLATEIGAVNTVVNRNGKLYGYNTDYFGFDYMCRKENIEFFNKKVLVLGNGGASKMVQVYLEHHKAKEVIVVSRKTKNNYADLTQWLDFDIIINTTPVGMYPNNYEQIIDLGEFCNCEAVVDLIYNPLKTKLIVQAEGLGINSATGLAMLVGQAVKAINLFIDSDIQMSKSDKVLAELETSMQNIVLIGMPGVGKSMIAKALASKLGRELVDFDTEIELNQGETISNIFAYKGEEYFREIEHKVALNFSKKQNYIIATGGGTPIFEENSAALKQNGYFVYVKGDIAKLDRANRPLSKSEEVLKQLYAKRDPIYSKIADVEIMVEDYADDTADKIIKKLKERDIL